jgi:phosphoribosylformylglycinamidine synthase subunit PurL
MQSFNFNNITDSEILELLKSNQIAMNPTEAKTLQNEILKREPTLAECILWGIQGSEHCSYRSSRSFLKQFPTTGPNVMLGVGEDAGIVEIARDNTGKKYGVVICHESHNSPSQIVPVEGSATGIGGCVRDVICMGAKVIGVSDSLRFGDISKTKTKWIHNGVVEGIAGYGNPIGVPNIGGDIYFSPSFDGACLVNVVALGILAEDEIIHSYAPANADGYDLILVGKPTDNSGFGGASFSSQVVKEEHREINKGAVQEPNAFLKRHIFKANYELFKILKEKQLLNKVGFKDLGAGGIACASVELADGSGYGAEIHLEKIHVGMDDLDPAIILCGETQERFMWAVPTEISELIVNHYNITFDFPNISKGAMASVVGKIKEGGQYTVYYKGEKIVDAKASDVTTGIVSERRYENRDKNLKEPKIIFDKDLVTINEITKSLDQIALEILRHQNIACRVPVYENFDKNVQGISVIEAGEADAAVLQPFKYDNYPAEIRQTGIVFKQDNNPSYGSIDAYWGGVNAVVECAYNIAAVGGTPQALTDCLNFGNPEKVDQMNDFVQGVRGVAETCKELTLKDYPGFALPVVSGNVSLYKENSQGETIPPSPIISIVGSIKDVKKSIKMSLTSANNELFMIGERKDECGGSVYYDLFNQLGANVPHPNIRQSQKEIFTIIDLIDQELVESCHDISDGGMFVTLAEMSFKNEIGFDVKIKSQLPADKILFSQSNGFVFEVKRENIEAVEKFCRLQNCNFYRIGKTINEKDILIQTNESKIELDLEEAKRGWTNGLREKL